MTRLNSAAPFTGTSLDRRHFLLSAGALAALSAQSVRSAEPPKRWRVGIVGHTGQGDYGHRLDTMWLLLPETVIVGFADPDDAGREKEKAKLPLIPDFADYRKMLKDLQPEIVVVAPRNLSEHRDMALAAIESGAKGLYIEKPFCRTPAEADEIVKACERSGTRIAIAHRNRFHPAFPAVLAAVQGGEIGDLLEIRCRGKEDQRGGCLDLWVLGSHDLDLCLPLAGRPTACSAVIQQGNRPATKEDMVPGAEGIGPILGNRVHARFETESGIPVFFDSIQKKGVPKAGFGLQLVGNQGLIDIRVDATPLAHLVPGNPFQPAAQPRPWVPITSAGVGKPEPIPDVKKQVASHVTAGRDLIQALQANRDPLSNEKTGQTVVEMIHAIFASHAANGARIALPLNERGHGLTPWL